MGSRERKRSERRKRKERSVDRQAELATMREARAARSEEKNQAVREGLEPLAPDERPTVVTVGAVISGVLSVSIVVAYLVGVEVGTFDDFGNETGEAKPNVISALIPAGMLAVMSWGMWKAKYWAVLGFQALLAILMVATVLGLVAATKVTQAVGNTLVLALAGFLFYKMVKAMARIQMPERR